MILLVIRESNLLVTVYVNAPIVFLPSFPFLNKGFVFVYSYSAQSSFTSSPFTQIPGSSHVLSPYSIFTRSVFTAPAPLSVRSNTTNTVMSFVTKTLLSSLFVALYVNVCTPISLVSIVSGDFDKVKSLFVPYFVRQIVGSINGKFFFTYTSATVFILGTSGGSTSNTKEPLSSFIRDRR